MAAPRGTPRADALAVVRPRAPRPRLRFLLRRRGGLNLWSSQQGRGCRWRFRRRYTRGLGGRRRAGRIIRCPSFVRRRSPIVPSPSFVGRVWRQRWPRRARVPVSTLIGEAFHAGRGGALTRLAGTRRAARTASRRRTLVKTRSDQHRHNKTPKVFGSASSRLPLTKPIHQRAPGHDDDDDARFYDRQQAYVHARGG